MRWENIGGKCGVWVVGVNQNIIQFFSLIDVGVIYYKMWSSP